MSKYDLLDPRTELEQTIARDLKSALEKRGLTVIHNADEGHAPAGLADIVVSSRTTVITFEVTKSRGASQDRELNSIRDHLNQIKAQSGKKKCYCTFVSLETSSRMLDGIRDHNYQRASEGIVDLRILPLCFDTLELWVSRLRESEADLYPVNDFIKLFGRQTEFVDDLRIRKLLYQYVFPLDAELGKAIEQEEEERDQRTLETLIKDLARMEDYMRQNGIAVGHAAIDTLIYLVFLKLYEEKREREGAKNRLRSPEAFEEFRRDSVNEPTRKTRRAVHELFAQVKQEGEFLKSGMFTPNDNLVDSVNDDFIVNNVIPMFREYAFLGTKLDALGAVYEVLALRAEKDVKVGQFFTPENVVKFMVKLAELDYKDLVLDPACGTGRFLIHAMNDMLGKVNKASIRNKEQEHEQVRLHRLFGADIDPRIAKIAKMNMWIHGDGKSNILGGSAYNGLTLHKHGFNGHDTFDNVFDAVLTNPPLGELNYQVIPFADPDDVRGPEEDLRLLLKTFERMPVLPRKNLTEERMGMVRERLVSYGQERLKLEDRIRTAEKMEAVQEWVILNKKESTKEERARKRELEQVEDVKTYQRLLSAAESKRKTIQENESKIADLEARLRSENVEWEITGNTMKGGAMFMAAIWHYLRVNAYPDQPPEWRGGKMLIILDEGILNTDDYKSVRGFLRSHFYLKAVISLTRDTFVPVSKTSTKTSILYAVKKSDLYARQKEPIFFGHVERVGMDTKRKVSPNDLEQMLTKYFEFKEKVLASYVRNEFRKEKFVAETFQAGNL